MLAAWWFSFWLLIFNSINCFLKIQFYAACKAKGNVILKFGLWLISMARKHQVLLVYLSLSLSLSLSHTHTHTHTEDHKSWSETSVSRACNRTVKFLAHTQQTSRLRGQRLPGKFTFGYIINCSSKIQSSQNQPEHGGVSFRFAKKKKWT